MDFDYSPRTKELQAQLLRFMDEHIYPAEQRYEDELEANTKAGKRWTPLQTIEELKPKARAQGLWNLFLPPTAGGKGSKDSGREFGLSNGDYAPLAEIMGRVPWSQRGLQLLGARHRQHGDDRALRLAGAEAAMAGAAARRQDPQRLRDDRAGGRLVGRDQHRGAHREEGQTSTSSTAASGGPAAPATRAARSTSSWARPTSTRRAIRSSRWSSCRPRPRASRSCGRSRCSATTTRRTATWRCCSRTCACRRATSCSARAAASRSRRAASARGASTTACA